MSEELKACPFCGQTDWKEIDHESISDARWMRCQKCSATSSWVWLDRYPTSTVKGMSIDDFRMLTREDTEKVWNTRPIEAAQAAEIERLREENKAMRDAIEKVVNHFSYAAMQAVHSAYAKVKVRREL